MATQVNYAGKYQQSLEQHFQDFGLRSAELWQSPSNALIRFDGAKHIKVPKLDVTQGRRDRSRRSIEYNMADYSNDWIPYELKFDRDWQTLVDPVDVDESNMVVSIGNITQQFNAEQKIPEMDRYLFSKLYQEKVALDTDKAGIHETSLTEKNILGEFDNMMMNFDENRVPSDNRILYITPKTYKALKSAEAINRTAVIAGNKNIDRTVYSLDDVQIRIVPSDLMQTEYDFSIGAVPKDSAKQISMFLIYNGVQIAPQKYSFVGMDAPSAHTNGNYHYYERAYADVFLQKSKHQGYEVYLEDKATSSVKGGK